MNPDGQDVRGGPRKHRVRAALNTGFVLGKLRRVGARETGPQPKSGTGNGGMNLRALPETPSIPRRWFCAASLLRGVRFCLEQSLWQPPPHCSSESFSRRRG